MSRVDPRASTRMGWVPWAGAAIGTLLALAWIVTALDDRSAAQKELQSARYEFEDKQARATNLEVLKLQLKEFELLIGVVSHRLPSRFDPPLLHAELRALATGTGVELTQTTDHEERKKEVYAERDIDVALRGPTESVYRFLEGLTLWGPAKNLNSLELSAMNSANTQLDARLRVTFYRYIDEAEGMGDAANAAR